MIPNHKLNEAFDALNLPRDASAQTVRDRVKMLRVRYAADDEKLSLVNEAFSVLEQFDATRRAQRDMIAMSTRSKGERDLDGHLVKLMVENAPTAAVKRTGEGSLDVVKKQKVDDEVKREPNDSAASEHGDEEVFLRLNKLLTQETKYLRAVNVLFNVVSSVIENKKLDSKTIGNLIDTVDIACTAKSTSDAGVPLANLNEDNRKAVTKLVNVILMNDPLVSHVENLKKGITKMWSHAVIFRNSLYQFDNFNYLRKCKELVVLVKELLTARSHEDEDRLRNELLISCEILCSKNVCRAIPGRLIDTKANMTEIYKITRSSGFPASFRDRVDELQKQLMSS